MDRLFSPDDLHRRIPGKLVIPRQQVGLSTLELTCYQYGPWMGLLAPLRDHLIIAHHRPSRISQLLDGRWRHEIIAPGEYSLLNQGTESSWQWLDPIETTDIHVSSDYLSKIATEVFDRDVEFSLVSNNLKIFDPILNGIVGSLEEEARNQELGGSLYMETLTNQLCVHLLRRHSTVSFHLPRIKGACSPSQAKRVKDYIESNLNGALSLNDLAGVVKVSPYHFARQFKERFGCPPHEYVISRRLNRAKELLTTSRMSLKEIACCCGFSDQAHMTRLFKRQLNLTPKVFRESRRAK